ncbi:WecB/TagA/CpsF family glycosyltransferase [Thalassospira marina]|uniref:Glycosyltransferase n=1 Tax=Thalassospira marina TaxID=2048283 RepID=A0ABM6Q6B6_9PROT|nr:WecB/TagA/CpsF family glycosyltransferase [Thalassospira marina]AUG52060.1 hypothetical protein CSC3H3_04470 [Thalassospira marina]
MGENKTFFDLQLDRRGPDQLRDDILARLKGGVRTCHISLNAIKLVAARKNPALWHCLQNCDCLSADGMGIVWAAKILGYQLAGRVTGIDLMMALMPGLAQQGAPVFLLGAKADIVARTARHLTRNYPGLNIAGYCDGYGKSNAEMAEIARQSGAKVVFVALPSPRKELFVTQYADACQALLLVGVGGAFDVISGQVRRAPVTWQKAGLEWFWRVLQAPRTMSGRYARGLGKFAILLAREVLKQRRETGRTCPQERAAQPQSSFPAVPRPVARFRLMRIITLIALLGGMLGGMLSAGSALGQNRDGALPQKASAIPVPPTPLNPTQLAAIHRNGVALATALDAITPAEKQAVKGDGGELAKTAAGIVAGFLGGLVQITHPGPLPAMDGQTLTSVLAAFFGQNQKAENDEWQRENTTIDRAQSPAGDAFGDGENAIAAGDTAVSRQQIAIRIMSTLEQTFAGLLVQQFIPATLMGGLQGLLANALLIAILRYGDGGGDPARLAFQYAPGLSAAAFGDTGDGFDRYSPVLSPVDTVVNEGVFARPGVVTQVFAAPEAGDHDIPPPFAPETPVVQNPNGNDDWWPDDASPR